MPSLFQWGLISLAILIIFLLVKFRYVKHKLTWIIIIILVVIGYTGFFISTAGQNIDLNSVEGIQIAGKLYLGWLSNSFSNLKTISSDAVKLDWSANQSNIVNEIKDKKK